MQRDVIIILGKTGFGKSTWLENYLSGLPRIFVFDPFRAMPAEYLLEDELLKRHEAGKFKMPETFRVGNYALPDMPLLGSIAYQAGNSAFIIEECGVSFRKGEYIDEWLQECIFLGRHVSLSLIFTAQRAASIPIELRSQANRFISFCQTESRDLNWVSDYIGAECTEELPRLPKFVCFDSDGNSVSRYEVSPLSAARKDSTPGEGSEDNTLASLFNFNQQPE